MIEINELTKRYDNGVLALDHVTYEIEPGEIFCLLGANGAGKSTTVNLLLDFIWYKDMDNVSFMGCLFD